MKFVLKFVLEFSLVGAPKEENHNQSRQPAKDGDWKVVEEAFAGDHVKAVADVNEDSPSVIRKKKIKGVFRHHEDQKDQYINSSSKERLFLKNIFVLRFLDCLDQRLLPCHAIRLQD